MAAWQYYSKSFRGSYGRLLFGVFSSVAQSLLLLPIIWLVRYAFDGITPSGQTHPLAVAGVVILLLTLLNSVVTLWARSTTLKATKVAIREFRDTLLKRCLRWWPCQSIPVSRQRNENTWLSALGASIGRGEMDTSAPAVAVVGTGYWGKNPVRNFHQLGVLASIYDSDPATLERFAKLYPDVPRCLAHSDVLQAPSVKAVAIATPAETHYALVEEALLAGKDVFMEKPLSSSR